MKHQASPLAGRDRHQDPARVKLPPRALSSALGPTGPWTLDLQRAAAIIQLADPIALRDRAAHRCKKGGNDSDRKERGTQIWKP
jgi:hypothetical protein